MVPSCLFIVSDYHDLFKDRLSKKIIITDNVWLASKATVLEWVKIGEGVVVACWVVVTNDLPQYIDIAGVPAKVINKLK